MMNYKKINAFIIQMYWFESKFNFCQMRLLAKHAVRFYNKMREKLVTYMQTNVISLQTKLSKTENVCHYRKPGLEKHLV